MTFPSPPGRWKRAPSARVSTSTSTPAETRKIAASTNDTAPKALIVSVVNCARPGHEGLLIPRQEHRRQQRRGGAGSKARVAVELAAGLDHARGAGPHADTPPAMCMRFISSAASAIGRLYAWRQPRLRRASSTFSVPFAEPTLPARSVARSSTS